VISDFAIGALWQGFALGLLVLFFSSVFLGFVAWVKGFLG
jgi:hypothetical protein